MWGDSTNEESFSIPFTSLLSKTALSFTVSELELKIASLPAENDSEENMIVKREIMTSLAQMYFKMKKFQECFTWLQKLLILDENNAGNWFMMGFVAVKLDLFEVAMHGFTTCSRLEPGNERYRKEFLMQCCKMPLNSMLNWEHVIEIIFRTLTLNFLEAHCHFLLDRMLQNSVLEDSSLKIMELFRNFFRPVCDYSATRSSLVYLESVWKKCESFSSWKVVQRKLFSASKLLREYYDEFSRLSKLKVCFQEKAEVSESSFAEIRFVGSLSFSEFSKFLIEKVLNVESNPIVVYFDQNFVPCEQGVKKRKFDCISSNSCISEEEKIALCPDDLKFFVKFASVILPSIPADTDCLSLINHVCTEFFTSFNLKLRGFQKKSALNTSNEPTDCFIEIQSELVGEENSCLLYFLHKYASLPEPLNLGSSDLISLFLHYCSKEGLKFVHSVDFELFTVLENAYNKNQHYSNRQALNFDQVCVYLFLNELKLERLLLSGDIPFEIVNHLVAVTARLYACVTYLNADLLNHDYVVRILWLYLRVKMLEPSPNIDHISTVFNTLRNMLRISAVKVHHIPEINLEQLDIYESQSYQHRLLTELYSCVENKAFDKVVTSVCFLINQSANNLSKSEICKINRVLVESYPSILSLKKEETLKLFQCCCFSLKYFHLLNNVNLKAIADLLHAFDFALWHVLLEFSCIKSTSDLSFEFILDKIQFPDIILRMDRTETKSLLLQIFMKSLMFNSSNEIFYHVTRSLLILYYLEMRDSKEETRKWLDGLLYIFEQFIFRNSFQRKSGQQVFDFKSLANDFLPLVLNIPFFVDSDVLNADLDGLFSMETHVRSLLQFCYIVYPVKLRYDPVDDLLNDSFTKDVADYKLLRFLNFAKNHLLYRRAFRTRLTSFNFKLLRKDWFCCSAVSMDDILSLFAAKINVDSIFYSLLEYQSRDDDILFLELSESIDLHGELEIDSDVEILDSFFRENCWSVISSAVMKDTYVFSSLNTNILVSQEYFNFIEAHSSILLKHFDRNSSYSSTSSKNSIIASQGTIKSTISRLNSLSRTIGSKRILFSGLPLNISYIADYSSILHRTPSYLEYKSLQDEEAALNVMQVLALKLLFKSGFTSVIGWYMLLLFFSHQMKMIFCDSSSHLLNFVNSSSKKCDWFWNYTCATKCLDVLQNIMKKSYDFVPLEIRGNFIQKESYITSNSIGGLLYTLNFDRVFKLPLFLDHRYFHALCHVNTHRVANSPYLLPDNLNVDTEFLKYFDSLLQSSCSKHDSASASVNLDWSYLFLRGQILSKLNHIDCISLFEGSLKLLSRIYSSLDYSISLNVDIPITEEEIVSFCHSTTEKLKSCPSTTDYDALAIPYAFCHFEIIKFRIRFEILKYSQFNFESRMCEVVAKNLISYLPHLQQICCVLYFFPPCHILMATVMKSIALYFASLKSSQNDLWKAVTVGRSDGTVSALLQCSQLILSNFLYESKHRKFFSSFLSSYNTVRNNVGDNNVLLNFEESIHHVLTLENCKYKNEDLFNEMLHLYMELCVLKFDWNSLKNVYAVVKSVHDEFTETSVAHIIYARFLLLFMVLVDVYKIDNLVNLLEPISSRCFEVACDLYQLNSKEQVSLLLLVPWKISIGVCNELIRNCYSIYDIYSALISHLIFHPYHQVASRDFSFRRLFEFEYPICLSYYSDSICRELEKIKTLGFSEETHLLTAYNFQFYFDQGNWDSAVLWFSDKGFARTRAAKEILKSLRFK